MHNTGLYSLYPKGNGLSFGIHGISQNSILSRWKSHLGTGIIIKHSVYVFITWSLTICA